MFTLYYRKRRLKKTMQAISDSGFFNADWYTKRYGDVIPQFMTPLQHYAERGAFEGKSPGPQFNSTWYLAQYPDVAAARIDPLLHYVRHGAAEGRTPMPFRSENDSEGVMQRIISSGFFDPNWYIDTYRDVPPSFMGPLEHWVKHGAFEVRSPGPKFNSVWYFHQNPDLPIGRMDPLLHFLEHGAAEGRRPAPPPGIVEAARLTINSILDLEPELYTADIFTQPERLPIVDGRASGKVYVAFRELFRSLTKPFKNIVFVPWLAYGGADRAAAHAIRALTEYYGPGSTLVVVADYDRVETKEWLPPDSELRVFSSFASDLSAKERADFVEILIRCLQPLNVLNINSGACWDAFVRRGRGLSTFTRLFAKCFCRDYSEDGRPVGYTDTHLRTALPALHRVYLDNKTFADELIAQYSLPRELADKLIVLKPPVRQAAMLGSRSEAGCSRHGLSVFWAGRFCRQKNVGLLLQIAELCRDDVLFEIWGLGGGAEEERLRRYADSHMKEFKLRGPYSSFDAIPHKNYDLFLYTSLWDGLPNVLVEAAAAGIPIVASDVGGVKELVNSETGWLVLDYENPLAYREAMYEAYNNPHERLKRCDNMLKVIAKTHSWGSYVRVLSHGSGLLEAAK
jgi:glycosyltransferase involved in cell wall biosynthesis